MTTTDTRIVGAAALVAELRDVRQRLTDMDPGFQSPYIDETATVGDATYGVLFRGRGEFRLTFGGPELTAVTVHGVDYRGNVELRDTGDGMVLLRDERYGQPQAYIRRDEQFSIADPTPAAAVKLYADDGILLSLADEVRGAFDDDRWVELDRLAAAQGDVERVHRAAVAAGRAIDEALAALDGVA